ncbi:DUF2934 domain-containing protein [Variovorax sp. OV329]|uniref:DUF2934 domain-containing protein n=1 Tax=Variovorax sp. OV329 TaxID=1882825 RepID=UPI0008EDD610|nr:DUF2934 domain-containing protein [Variovorax sp. OV329]SFM62316.1 Protein of unknown function [Variovorax sp. OV329]
MSNSSMKPITAPPGFQEVSGGDRGDAGSVNMEQSRAIGQDDPSEGSRMGREANKPSGYPGSEARRDPKLARDEAIRQAAYEAYLRRGGNAGSDVDDWLEAERAFDQGEGRADAQR